MVANGKKLARFITLLISTFIAVFDLGKALQTDGNIHVNNDRNMSTLPKSTVMHHHSILSQQKSIDCMSEISLLYKIAPINIVTHGSMIFVISQIVN